MEIKNLAPLRPGDGVMTGEDWKAACKSNKILSLKKACERCAFITGSKICNCPLHVCMRQADFKNDNQIAEYGCPLDHRWPKHNMRVYMANKELGPQIKLMSSKWRKMETGHPF